MINKVRKDAFSGRRRYSVRDYQFWNVKVVSRRPTSLDVTPVGDVPEPPYAEEERRETPASLKDTQVRMEQQVYRIWT